jgi:uncharacterized membrane protein
MPSYSEIIARTSSQRLVTVAPHLRLLPPPEVPADHMTKAEIMAWARRRGQARGYRPMTEAQKAVADAENRHLRNQSGVWYVDVTIDGRRTTRSLETEDIEEARRLRDEIYQGRRALRPGRSVTIPDQTRRVLAVLADGPTNVKTMALRSKLSEPTVHRRIRELLAAGTVRKVRFGLWGLAA